MVKVLASCAYHLSFGAIKCLPLLRLPFDPAIGRATQYCDGGHAGAGEEVIPYKNEVISALLQYAIGHQLLAKAFLRSAFDGCNDVDPGGRVFVHHKAFRCVLAHAIGFRPFAEKKFWCADMAISTNGSTR